MWGIIALTALISGAICYAVGCWKGAHSKTFEIMRAFLADEQKKKGI